MTPSSPPDDRDSTPPPDASAAGGGEPSSDGVGAGERPTANRGSDVARERPAASGDFPREGEEPADPDATAEAPGSQPGAAGDFYQVLRRRIRDWLAKRGKAYKYADLLLVAPDLVHLLSKLAIDPRIPLGDKAKIAVVLAYFVSPVDLLPEGVMGPVGLIDDVALSAYVLNGFVNAGHGNIAKEHWAGNEDLLVVLQRILGVAESALGSGLWQRLQRLGDTGGTRK